MPTVTVYATGAGDWAVTSGANVTRADNTTASETVSSGGPSTKYNFGYWRWIGASFPVGAVSSATLHLVCESTDSTAPHEHPVNELTVDPTDSAYSSALPPNDGDLLGVVGSTTSISATSLVQGWVDNPSSAYGVVTDLEYRENDGTVHSFSGYDTARVTYTYSTNTAPTASMLTADALALPAGTESVQLQASVTDPNAGDTVTTKFFLSETSTLDPNTFEQTQATAPLSNSTQSVTFTNLSPGQYWWWVSASDGTETSALQGPRTFTIANAPLPAPGVFTAPTAGTTYDITGTVAHGISVDPEGATVSYEVEIQPTTGAVWQPFLALSTSTSRTGNFSSFANSTSARLRVRAYDGISYSSWRTSSTFTIFHNTAPTISPVTADAVTFSETGPILTTSITDPDSQSLTVTYEILDAGLNVLDTGVLNRTGPASGLQVSYSPPELPAADYQWRARIFDGMTTSSWTALRTFTLQRIPTFFGGAKKVIDVLLGTTEVGAVYLGSDLVWERVRYPVADWIVSTAEPYRRSASLQFTSQATESPIAWEWDFGDGTTSTDQNPVKSFSTTGVKQVSHRATNLTGTGDWVTKSITIVIPEPVSSFTSNSPVGLGQAIQFTDTSSNSPTSWYWTFGDGTTSTQQNPSKTYAAQGDYTVTLRASNSTGQGTLASETVTVTPLAVPAGTIAMFDTVSVPAGWAICDGTNGTLDMRNRFIVGSGTSYTLGSIGGASTVTLTESQMPLHSHNVSEGGGGAHSDHLTNDTGSHDHNRSGTTGGHSHNYSGASGSRLRGATPTSTNRVLVNSISTVSTINTGTDPAHPEGRSGTSGAHTHTSGAASSSSHTHSYDDAAAGGGTSHSNMPPYYALAYAQATEDVFPTVGMIGMTTASTAPAGWGICNGTAAAPDLRGRFVIGQGTTYALNATGGAATVTLALADIPAHSHGVSISNSLAAHTHNLVSAGGHSHIYDAQNHASHHHNAAQDVTATTLASGSGVTQLMNVVGTIIQHKASNAHTVTWASLTWAHNHNVGAVNAGHTHSLSSGSTGTGGSHNNMPPYLAVNFIRMLSASDDLPSGLVLAYNGTTAPAGWTALTTMDGRFPLGVSTTYALGTTGGANTANATVPSHAHTLNSISANMNHSHAAASGNTAHSHSASVSHVGNHTHSVAVANSTQAITTGNITKGYGASASKSTATHNHSHNWGSIFGNDGSHSHSVGSSGSHTHGASMGNAGSNTAHENRPPYRAVLFIQKV